MQRAFAIALGIFCGFAAFAIGWSVTASKPIAGACALAFAAIVAVWCEKSASLKLQTDAVPRSYKWLALIASVLALVQVGRETIFMVDSTAVGYSNLPSSQFELRHSCLSSYFCAAKVADTQPNIYDESIYALPSNPNEPRKPRVLDGFKIDQFEYPPPFLLMPRVLRLIAPEFLPHRALWFGLNLLVIGGAMLFAARSLGSSAGSRAIILLPLIFMALPTISMLQKGNIQGMVIALAMIAMLCFERGKNAVGGALLAYTVVSKLFPGLLLFYLLVRKQWNALAWTAAMGVVYLLLSVADVGTQPYFAFMKHLPGLVGGEAFPAFRNPAAMAINLSIPGLIFKLKLFDVPGMGFAAAKLVGWIYTVVAVAMTIVMARRVRTEQEKTVVFLAILTLATLRSPFLPTAYAAFPPLWLLTLAGAVMAPTIRTLMGIVLLCLLLNVYSALDLLPPKSMALLSALPQAVLIGLPIWVFFWLRPAPKLTGNSAALQPTAA
ncbi:MAG: glycosyltransferase family 87 protein [Povalibacter sp.]